MSNATTLAQTAVSKISIAFIKGLVEAVGERSIKFVRKYGVNRKINIDDIPEDEDVSRYFMYSNSDKVTKAAYLYYTIYQMVGFAVEGSVVKVEFVPVEFYSIGTEGKDSEERRSIRFTAMIADSKPETKCDPTTNVCGISAAINMPLLENTTIPSHFRLIALLFAAVINVHPDVPKPSVKTDIRRQILAPLLDMYTQNGDAFNLASIMGDQPLVPVIKVSLEKFFYTNKEKKVSLNISMGLGWNPSPERKSIMCNFKDVFQMTREEYEDFIEENPRLKKEFTRIEGKNGKDTYVRARPVLTNGELRPNGEVDTYVNPLFEYVNAPKLMNRESVFTSKYLGAINFTRTIFVFEGATTALAKFTFTAREIINPDAIERAAHQACTNEEYEEMGGENDGKKFSEKFKERATFGKNESKATGKADSTEQVIDMPKPATAPAAPIAPTRTTKPGTEESGKSKSIAGLTSMRKTLDESDGDDSDAHTSVSQRSQRSHRGAAKPVGNVKKSIANPDEDDEEDDQ